MSDRNVDGTRKRSSPARMPDELAAALPGDRIETEPEKLAEYAMDLTEEKGFPPVAVLKPCAVEELRSCTKAAGACGIRLLPVVANTNVGGLALPRDERCAILDLRDMNRIVELNCRDRYIVVEPGVTWQQLKEHLDANAPGLRFGYPLAPPHSSVLAGCILDGLGNLSLRHGSMNHWINGLEAVLPNGEKVVTGTRCWSPEGAWCCRGPLPDLTGLFLNFQGATGIVTRVSLQLWPKPAHRQRLFCLVPTAAMGLDLLEELAGAELCDDLGALSWPLSRLLLGSEPGTARAPGDPELFAYLDLSGRDPKELDLREKSLRRIMAGHWKDYSENLFPLDWVVRIDPSFKQLAEFPTRLGFLLDHPGGGLSWVGTYGPISRWNEAAHTAMRLMTERGFPPSMVARPMLAGHFCVLRFLVTFDRSDEELCQRIRALHETLLDALLPLGFLTYKTPRWALSRRGAMLQKGYRDLLRRIVDLMDPDDCLDSNRWRLEEG